MKTLQDLQADVTAQGTVIESAKTLLAGLADQIRNLPADQQAISDLADKIEGQTADLSKAITDNTPAAPTV